MTWQEHIKTVRLELNLTQVEFSRATGKTQCTISNWEAGRTIRPPVKSVNAVNAAVKNYNRPDLRWRWGEENE